MGSPDMIRTVRWRVRKTERIIEALSREASKAQIRVSKFYSLCPLPSFSFQKINRLDCPLEPPSILGRFTKSTSESVSLALGLTPQHHKIKSCFVTSPETNLYDRLLARIVFYEDILYIPFFSPDRCVFVQACLSAKSLQATHKSVSFRFGIPHIHRTSSLKRIDRVLD
jgi:hypothetical protein